VHFTRSRDVDYIASSVQAGGRGVLIAFTGGGGSPLFFASQNEYRPTEISQKWILKWSNSGNRLAMAKQFQIIRCETVEKYWTALHKTTVFKFNFEKFSKCLVAYRQGISGATSNEQLMGYEANFVKGLYAIVAEFANVKFLRNSEAGDSLNTMLNAGNYLAYGLAGSALWISGVPHSMPVSHGMTRRGALVFDVADIIKDAFVLSSAAISLSEMEALKSFRRRVMDAFHQKSVLALLLESIQGVAR
jgi:CRISPR-associated protein Cas1